MGYRRRTLRFMIRFVNAEKSLFSSFQTRLTPRVINTNKKLSTKGFRSENHQLLWLDFIRNCYHALFTASLQWWRFRIQVDKIAIT